jgi:hypothetical protein
LLRTLYDESCTGGRDKALVIAGWIANADEWDVFSSAWYDCLSENPKIDYFSHHESVTRERGTQFFGFSCAERDRKVMSLAEVVCESPIRRGFLTDTPHGLFAAAPKKLRGMYGTKVYEWAFHNAVSIAIHSQLIEGETDKVDFVFDKRSDLPNCIKVFEEIRPKIGAGIRALMGTITPGDDIDVLGLQAADLLAGQWCYFVKNGHTLPPFKKLAICKPLCHSPFDPPKQLATSLELIGSLYSLRGEFNEFMKAIRKVSRAKNK